MTPKLSIAIHSGVFGYWPLLQNLLKSFLVCNEYPSIEIILVESGGNKKIRDWFEKIDFDDQVGSLDVSILQDWILTPLLGIKDQRTPPKRL